MNNIDQMLKYHKLNTDSVTLRVKRQEIISIQRESLVTASIYSLPRR